MADRDSIYAWLAAKRYRVVDERHPAWSIVLRLVYEGRARWHCAAYRVSAVPPRRGHQVSTVTNGEGPER